MTPKYPKGLLVEFTFSDSGTMPSSKVWFDTHRKGCGEIVSFNRTSEFYSVKVVDPPNWNHGHDGGGHLHGKDVSKGWFFNEDAIRPLASSPALIQSTAAVKISPSQKFASGAKVAFTYEASICNPSIAYVWQNRWNDRGAIGRGVVKGYDDDAHEYPYAVEFIAPPELKGQLYHFDEDALRLVFDDSSETVQSKATAGEREQKRWYEFLKGEDKTEERCSRCGRPMKMLFSSSYCPNGCKPGSEAEPKVLRRIKR